jgi:glycosyltransferase involved in cell wall biosynthesis
MSISEIIDSLNKKKYNNVINLSLEKLTKGKEFYIYYEYISESYYKLADFDAALVFVNKGLKINPRSIKLTDIKNKLEKNNAFSYGVVGQYYTYPISNEKRLFESVRRVNKTESEEPLVSIVTALYDNDKTLERCLKSVQNQNYKNIEHIIIDGGSNENVIKILEKYENKVAYIISEKDNGIYHAMNKGIKLARGEYICLVNSDDFYDEDHILNLVKEIKKSKSDVVYTNFNIDKNKCKSSESIDAGIYFGNLNVNHASFLVSKQTYNKVGLYDENLKIISDIKWIRDAYEAKVDFHYFDAYTFNFSTGGLSGGVSESHKKLMHKEITSLYQDSFSFLKASECIRIYNFRFNPNNTHFISEILHKYTSEVSLLSALRKYVLDCLLYRDNFNLEHTESGGIFVKLLSLTSLLNIPLSSIRIRTKFGCFSSYVEKIDKICQRIGALNKKKTILNYAHIFSTPSETFIYDIVKRLEGQGYDCVFLCDEVKLEKERPLQNKIHIPWAHLRHELREKLYQYLIDSIKPDLLLSHFALNDWKLKQRLKPLGIELPTISMTHGIDVFIAKENQEYRKFLLDEYGKDKSNRLSTVSKFLKNTLIEVGVKEEKIDLIHNSIDDVFYTNRKSVVKNKKNKKINVLSIGRCIEWKGHDDVIQAIYLLRKDHYLDIELTIVYGKSEGCLTNLKALTNKLELSNQIHFIDFVNFKENPTYFNQFDLYVQASKYSDDLIPRTETFGVAALEAIASGLPVVVTDAGGLPEVAGEDTKFSKIAKNNNYIDMAEKIFQIINEGSIYESNEGYAIDRLEHFSEKKQMSKFEVLISKVLNKNINIALFSANTIYGAGYAAYRVLQSLRHYTNTVPTMHTTDLTHIKNKSVNVIEHPQGKGNSWRSYQRPSNSKDGMTIFSYNEPILSNQDLYEIVKDSEVIHLHWIARFLSLENIAFLSNLNKPLIMTIRDMYPLTGGCHYFHGCEEWKRDCNNCHQLFDDINNISSQTLEYKKSNYNFENITITCLSQHTKNIISKSIYKNCKVNVIPNSIELGVFKPDYKREKRKELNISDNKKIIGFVPSFNSDVKGFKEAIEVLNQLTKNSKFGDDIVVLIIGNGSAAEKLINAECYNVGYVNDNIELAKYYSAMDVLLLPSLEETFSNTTAESIACGTPVAGFATGAIGDLAIEGKTGKAVPVGNTIALQDAVVEVLNSKYNRHEVRAFAVERLDMKLQARAYEYLYRELLTSQVSKIPNYEKSVGFYNYDDLNKFISIKNG